MFESAKLEHHLDDDAYEKEVKKLRGDLLDAQFELLERKTFPVIVLVNGVDAAGKGETVNLLNEWLDPRHVTSRAFGPVNEIEKDRPPMWRFWCSLPPKGKIGILFGNWYTDPIVDRVEHGLGKNELSAAIERIRKFETLLVDDGALLVKLWFHLSKKGQRKALRTLEKNKLTRWRVTKTDWKHYELHRPYERVSERILRETSLPGAPWTVIDGSDANYRAITAGRAICSALTQRLRRETKPTNGKRTNGKHAAEPTRSFGGVDTVRILRDLPFEERLSREKYDTKIVKEQGKLARLSRSSKLGDRSVVIALEGMDAAGKGGAIRRITQALDARSYDVIPIAAPTQEERAQPYLWRFWRHLPKRRHFVIYDRSWYGRVLVERVEGFASEAEWGRAYAEINDFEEQLVEHGVVVVKLWLALTKDEQLRRFKEREQTRFKQFKITPEDWRNRKKWDDYLVAASDTIDRTSTAYAPWTVIEANDKHLARVRAIETVCERIETSFRR